MDKQFQRKGGKSNSEVGREFEDMAFEYFLKEGIHLNRSYAIDIGIKYKKPHKFDFGNKDFLIECKSMKWTESGNIPSAKLKNWNEAMFLFLLSPKNYKKIFFVEMDYSQKYCKTLLEYYIDLNYHLIPNDVIFYDYYVKNKQCKIYTFEDIIKRNKIL